MNGDGQDTQSGGGGSVDGEPITPSSVTTPLLNATTGTITTLNSTTATLSTGIISTLAYGNASGLSMNSDQSRIGALTFRIADQRDPVNSAVVNYRMPLTQPPQDGLTYSLCNNSAPTSVYNTPATGAAISILLETAAYSQTIRIVFTPSTQITSEFLFDRVNQSIASWFSQQGAPQDIFFTLDTSFFPYRTRLQILFAASRSQLNIDANNQMLLTLGWTASTGLQTGPITLTSPNAANITARIDNTTLLWRNVDAIVPNQNSIQAPQGSSSVICNEIGSNLVSITGSVDMNEGNIARIQSLNSDSASLTLNCGQSQLQIASVADGLSQSTTTYLTATDGFSNAGVGCSVDSAFLIQNSFPRLVVDSAATTLFSASTAQRIQVNTYGSLLSAGGQPGAGLACNINLDGDIFFNRDNGTGLSEIFYASNQGTQLFSSDGSTRLYLSNITEPGGKGVYINPLLGGYRLPLVDGAAKQVITTDGAGVATWQSQTPGIYSATTPVTIANTATQLTLIGAGQGSLTVPANFFTAGMSFTYRTGGIFGALNNATIRFRLTNSGTLFDSGILTFSPAIASGRPWNIDVTFTYTGGSQMITSFNYQYSTGADARGFTAQQVNNTFNPAIVNTLGFTAQWGAASASNTITANYGVLSRLF